MFRSRIASIVTASTRHPWLVIAIAALLTVVTSAYSAHNFSINTDVNKLIAQDIPWRQREHAVDKAFPGRHQRILAVVEAPTSELATQATDSLVEKLKSQPNMFPSVREPGGSDFFVRNALLFLPTEGLQNTVTQYTQSQALIQVLVSDPSWRGLSQALSYALTGMQRKLYTLDQMTRPLTMFAAPLEKVVAGEPATFSWRELVARKDPAPSDLRRVVEIKPVLDYESLEPGEAATNQIRKDVADLKLTSEYGARVRLTGPVPIQDEEFSTLKENADINAIVSLAFLIGILWLALRSPRIIIAVLISITVGLSITAALGLLMVGSLNPISVAFAVLFVGIGVDFGIQFSVRYRAERYEINNLRVALANTGKHVGVPLTLAATATAAGFLSFLPTDYKGVSELGQIAGAGMLIAYIISITLLPALLSLFNPPGEKEPLGYSALAPVDSFMERHRIPIIIGTALVSLGGLPLLYYLQFDFNPINLRSPKVESIATYLDLRRDPNAGANGVDVLTPNVAAAREVAARLRKVPEVERVLSLDSFVPTDQQAKLALIKQAATKLEPALNAAQKPAPTDEESITALNRGADALEKAADEQTGTGPDAARRLGEVMTKHANADQATRERAKDVLIEPLKVALTGLRKSFQAEEITESNLPPEVSDNWITEDGRVRVEAHPKGDPNDNDVLRKFARAVLAAVPNASGGPISILETGQTVVHAFIVAGICALISISLLLWLTLRRFSDVLLTLIPLLLAGVVTLEICVLIGLPLNFANIIALPLLLGVGVAFKIYYIMAWRAGQTGLLQSALTRAVMFSAMTTATAFGSLWLSSHPGTSSMGKLLALSLVCTLAAAVLFQPVLMGPPREVGDT
jgi:hopanoid biosynthesis associated RND transporter like protein HpnN